MCRVGKVSSCTAACFGAPASPGKPLVSAPLPSLRQQGRGWGAVQEARHLALGAVFGQQSPCLDSSRRGDGCCLLSAAAPQGAGRTERGCHLRAQGAEPPNSTQKSTAPARGRSQPYLQGFIILFYGEHFHSVFAEESKGRRSAVPVLAPAPCPLCLAGAGIGTKSSLHPLEQPPCCPAP